LKRYENLSEVSVDRKGYKKFALGSLGALAGMSGLAFLAKAAGIFVAAPLFLFAGLLWLFGFAFALVIKVFKLALKIRKEEFQRNSEMGEIEQMVRGTMQAIKATVYQEVEEIDFYHTNAKMVDVRVRGDDVGHMSFSIGKAVFFLEGTGTKLQHVPYRGTQPAIVDLIGGQVAGVSGPVGEFLQHLPGGKVRLLATSGAARNRFAPAVPTYAEQGFKDIVFDEWFGFFMPAKVPADVLARASTAIRAVWGGLLSTGRRGSRTDKSVRNRRIVCFHVARSAGDSVARSSACSSATSIACPTATTCRCACGVHVSCCCRPRCP
jgi:hypothetical protein